MLIALAGSLCQCSKCWPVMNLDSVHLDSYSRLTFLQGILDQADFYAGSPTEDDGPPAQPDTKVMDVNLNGVIWSTYLAIHYFRKNKNGAGKLAMTSSTAGIYQTGEVPLYAAAKHGVRPLFRLSNQD